MHSWLKGIKKNLNGSSHNPKWQKKKKPLFLEFVTFCFMKASLCLIQNPATHNSEKWTYRGQKTLQHKGRFSQEEMHSRNSQDTSSCHLHIYGGQAAASYLAPLLCLFSNSAIFTPDGLQSGNTALTAVPCAQQECLNRQRIQARLNALLQLSCSVAAPVHNEYAVRFFITESHWRSWWIKCRYIMLYEVFCISKYITRPLMIRWAERNQTPK